VYHVDLRSGMYAARAFNLDGDQLERRFLAPMRSGRVFDYEDREWDPRDTEMVVFEGGHLRPDQMGLGRGWATVEKHGTDVTAQVMADSPATAARPANSSPLMDRLIGRLAAGPVTLPEVIALAADLAPEGNMEEHAGASAQAIWELLRSGGAQLSASGK
jgi:hypothetical protein